MPTILLHTDCDGSDGEVAMTTSPSCGPPRSRRAMGSGHSSTMSPPEVSVGFIDGPIHCVMESTKWLTSATNAPNCSMSTIQERSVDQPASASASAVLVDAPDNRLWRGACNVGVRMACSGNRLLSTQRAAVGSGTRRSLLRTISAELEHDCRRRATRVGDPGRTARSTPSPLTVTNSHTLHHHILTYILTHDLT